MKELENVPGWFQFAGKLPSAILSHGLKSLVLFVQNFWLRACGQSMINTRDHE
jgi:hypothetical protein